MGFAKPATLEAAPKSSKKAQRAEVAIEKLEKLTALRVAIQALEARASSLEDDVRAEGLDLIITEATSTGRRPANFLAVEGVGSAGYELKNRSPLSALTPEVADELRAAGIPVGERVLKTSYIAVNPKYAGDTEMLEKADAALAAADLPADFIVSTPEAKSQIAGEGAIEAVCALKDEAKIRKLLPFVSTTAISKVTASDVVRALEIVKPEVDILFAPLVAAKAPVVAQSLSAIVEAKKKKAA